MHQDSIGVVFSATSPFDPPQKNMSGCSSKSHLSFCLIFRKRAKNELTQGGIAVQGDAKDAVRGAQLMAVGGVGVGDSSGEGAVGRGITGHPLIVGISATGLGNLHSAAVAHQSSESENASQIAGGIAGISGRAGSVPGTKDASRRLPSTDGATLEGHHQSHNTIPHTEQQQRVSIAPDTATTKQQQPPPLPQQASLAVTEAGDQASYLPPLFASSYAVPYHMQVNTEAKICVCAIGGGGGGVCPLKEKTSSGQKGCVCNLCRCVVHWCNSFCLGKTVGGNWDTHVSHKQHQCHLTRYS